MVSAIIQARTGSTRLPGKVLMKLAGKTVLEHVIERVSMAETVDNIVVATTMDKNDKNILELCNKNGINVFCGSEDDVLDRYYQVARHFGIKDIVRITSDCPLIDPEILDDTVRLYKKTGADYATNIIEESFPDGLDVEVFSFGTLEDAWQNARFVSDREHVTSYIKKNGDRFKIVSSRNDVDLSGKRWTIDRQEDFDFLRLIFEGIYYRNPKFRMGDVLEFIEKNPEIEKINSHIVRNEGYIKSLKQDMKIEAGYQK